MKTTITLLALLAISGTTNVIYTKSAYERNQALVACAQANDRFACQWETHPVGGNAAPAPQVAQAQQQPILLPPPAL